MDVGGSLAKLMPPMIPQDKLWLERIGKRPSEIEVDIVNLLLCLNSTNLSVAIILSNKMFSTIRYKTSQKFCMK